MDSLRLFYDWKRVLKRVFGPKVNQYWGGLDEVAPFKCAYVEKYMLTHTAEQFPSRRAASKEIDVRLQIYKKNLRILEPAATR